MVTFNNLVKSKFLNKKHLVLINQKKLVLGLRLT